jgi:hypothetical protein
MAYNLIIIDDFYNNPEEVREFALAQDFDVDGNYPGHRTKSFLTDSIKEYIGEHLEPLHGKILWPEEGHEEYTGSFQFTTCEDRSWIHADGNTKWAGVIYLTPNAPVSGGTALYKHIPTGLTSKPYLPSGETNEELFSIIEDDGNDYTKWEMTDRVANIFNRLVLYRGDAFHASLDYFGKDINDGRLFQTFFFNTEN